MSAKRARALDLKWVGLGLVGVFAEQIFGKNGLNSCNFKEIFEVKSLNSGEMGLGSGEIRGKNWLKSRILENWSLQNGSKLQGDERPESLKKGVLSFHVSASPTLTTCVRALKGAHGFSAPFFPAFLAEADYAMATEFIHLFIHFRFIQHCIVARRLNYSNIYYI